MNIREQVVAEIARLNKILALLDEGTDTVRRGRPRGKRRKMSAAGRRRIAAAQRARWKKIREGSK